MASIKYELDLHEKSEINQKVAQLTAKTVSALQAEQDRLGIKNYSGRGRKINIRLSDKNGLVNKISFKFPRYMAYVEKGARRGYGGSKGSEWKNKSGETIRTNPASLGKMNTGDSEAKEWFNPVIENFTEQLVKEVAHEFVQLSFKNLRIK
jgi:hypothetical protein